MSKPLLLIIGKVPPPIGGVTVHIDRLLRGLKNNSIEYCFYDYGKESYVNGMKKIFEAKIIHIHLSNKNIRLSFVLFLKFIQKKIIITFHGKYSFDDFRDLFSLYAASYSFVLNQYTYESAAKRIQANKLALVSAFIPPYEDNILSTDICNQIYRLTKDKKYILCTNASNYVIDKNGQDLYGIDFLINFVKTRSDLCLIISDPSGRLKEKYQVQYENILFISDPHPFFQVIKESDIYIRATTTDGDSLSVKEALFYGKKVVASDCVDRPYGCFLYKAGDVQTFETALFQPWREKNINVQDGSEQIIKLYRSLSEGEANVNT